MCCSHGSMVTSVTSDLLKSVRDDHSAYFDLVIEDDESYCSSISCLQARACLQPVAPASDLNGPHVTYHKSVKEVSFITIIQI